MAEHTDEMQKSIEQERKLLAVSCQPQTKQDVGIGVGTQP